MKTWTVRLGTVIVLLLGLPSVALAGELDSIFGQFVLLIKGALVTVVVAVCAVLLIKTILRVELPAAAPAAPDSESSASPTWLSGSRVGRVALLAAPGYAAWLYVAAYHSFEYAAGQYVAFYAPFLLSTAGAMTLLWLAKRPSAAIGLGVSAVLVLGLLRGLTQQWNQDGDLYRYRHAGNRGRQPSEGGIASLPDSLASGLYTYVEQMPAFEGGPDSLQQAIQGQLRYPEYALGQRVAGDVVVGCVVAEAGDVVGVTLVRGIGAGCDEEAMRVVKNLQFRPGRQHEQTVRVYITVDVHFELPRTADSELSTR